MITLLATEIMKLRRSLVIYYAAGAPLFVGLMAFLTNLDPRPSPMARMLMLTGWERMVGNALMNWAFLLLPLSVTVLAVLVAQIEHGPKAWNYVLALPVRRWKLYLAKSLIVCGLTLGMSLSLVVWLWVSGVAHGWVRPAFTGAYDWADALEKVMLMWAASLLQTGILLWVALRFKSFMPAMGVGIGGAFASMAIFIHDMSQRQEGLSVWLPWLLPLNVVRPIPTDQPVVLFGAVGGLVVMGLMLIDLSRREIR